MYFHLFIKPSYEYGVLTKLFLLFLGKYQWTVALFLPFIKEFNTWILMKYITNSANTDVSRARIACEMIELVFYA